MSFYTISGAILCVLNIISATCVGLCGTCAGRNGKSGEKCGKHTNFFGVAFGRKGSKNAFVTSWKSVRGKSPKKYMPYVFYEKAYVFFGVQCRPQNFL